MTEQPDLSRRDSQRESRMQSHAPYQAIPSQADLSTSTVTIHPPLSTSTRDPQTVDGQPPRPPTDTNLVKCGHCRALKPVDAWCHSDACTERVAAAQALDRALNGYGDHMGTGDVVPVDRPVVQTAAYDHLVTLDLEAQLDALVATVTEVHKLHQPDGTGYCTSCRTDQWPCKTALAIGAGR